jgi:hypothetical protein
MTRSARAAAAALQEWIDELLRFRITEGKWRA